MSADVAAMAPGTRTGAASPVIAIGGFTIGVDEVLRRKIMILEDLQYRYEGLKQRITLVRSYL